MAAEEEKYSVCIIMQVDILIIIFFQTLFTNSKHINLNNYY